MSQCCICGNKIGFFDGDNSLSPEYVDYKLCDKCNANLTAIREVKNTRNIILYEKVKSKLNVQMQSVESQVVKAEI